MKYIPPWKEPYFIGVAGCSGSGKTSVTNILTKELNVPWTVQLSMDNFYKHMCEEDRQKAYKGDFDFDSPNAIDFDLLIKVLGDIKSGKRTQIPVYSFVTHSRTDKTTEIYGANIVIVEGIMALFDERIRNMLDFKIFVTEDFDVCFARRLSRDILERGRELESGIRQWQRFVKPNYISSIMPTSRQADVMLPNGKENKVAINMILGHIRRKLVQQSRHHLEELQKLDGKHIDITEFGHQLPETNQTRAIHTILVNRKTSRDDFIFYFNRIADMLITLALEKSLASACQPLSVMTPIDKEFEGVKVPFDRVAAVTIIRGGECFETALKASIPTIKLGRLLIQTDTQTGEPQLHTRKLPDLVSEGSSSKILLVDTQVLSGSAAVMAIAVLVDHGIEESDITFITYYASEIGLRRIYCAFPNVKIIYAMQTTQPLILDLDVRYYGT